MNCIEYHISISISMATVFVWQVLQGSAGGWVGGGRAQRDAADSWVRPYLAVQGRIGLEKVCKLYFICWEILHRVRLTWVVQECPGKRTEESY